MVLCRGLESQKVPETRETAGMVSDLLPSYIWENTEGPYEHEEVAYAIAVIAILNVVKLRK